MKEFIIFFIQAMKEGMNLTCYQRQINPVAREEYPFAILDPISTAPVGMNTLTRDGDPVRIFSNTMQLAIFSNIETEYATQIASDVYTYLGSLWFIEKANASGFSVTNLQQPFNIQITDFDRASAVQQCIITFDYMYGNSLPSQYGKVENIQGEVDAR